MILRRQCGFIRPAKVFSHQKIRQKTQIKVPSIDLENLNLHPLKSGESWPCCKSGSQHRSFCYQHLMIFPGPANSNQGCFILLSLWAQGDPCLRMHWKVLGKAGVADITHWLLAGPQMFPQAYTACIWDCIMCSPTNYLLGLWHQGSLRAILPSSCLVVRYLSINTVPLQRLPQPCVFLLGTSIFSPGVFVFRPRQYW